LERLYLMEVVLKCLSKAVLISSWYSIRSALDSFYC
jgi:hypothetical protein